MNNTIKGSEYIFKRVHIIGLLSIMILMQSCYVYRSVPMNNVFVGSEKNYKIVEGYEKRKVQIIAIKDSSLVVEDWEGQREIKKSAIDNIKAKKFSPLLTVGTILGSIYVGAVALVLIVFSLSSY